MSEALVRVIARLQFETQAASEVIIDQAGRSFLRADGPAESTSRLLHRPISVTAPARFSFDLARARHQSKANLSEGGRRCVFELE